MKIQYRIIRRLDNKFQLQSRTGWMDTWCRTGQAFETLDLAKADMNDRLQPDPSTVAEVVWPTKGRASHDR